MRYACFAASPQIASAPFSRIIGLDGTVCWDTVHERLSGRATLLEVFIIIHYARQDELVQLVPLESDA